ncbi:MAG: hypothetical protein QRY74_03800 [Chlamydia sp.]
MIHSDRSTGIKSLFQLDEQEKEQFLAALQQSNSAFCFQGRTIHVLSQDFYKIKNREKLSNSVEASCYIIQAFSKGQIVIEETKSSTVASGKIRILSAASSDKGRMHQLFASRCSHKEGAFTSQDSATIYNTINFADAFSIEQITEEELKQIQKEIADLLINGIELPELEIKASSNTPHDPLTKKSFSSHKNGATAEYTTMTPELSTIKANIAKQLEENGKKEREYRKKDDKEIEASSQIRKEHIKKTELKRKADRSSHTR